MPTALSIVLSLFALFLVQFLLGLRRVTRNVGSVTQRAFDLRNDEVDQLWCDFTATSPAHFFSSTCILLQDT
jgi:hypothetical protein